MSELHSSAWLSHWMTHVDDLPVDDDALRTFAHLLRAYLARDAEDREDLATMAAIVVDPESDADDVQAALDTLRESLHTTAEAFDLESEDDLDESEREVARRMDAEEATFAERLGAVMAAKGMSQSQLARASGVGQPAISMMLARDCRPQRRTVEKLSHALGVAAGELWPAASKASGPDSAPKVEAPSIPEVGEWASIEPMGRIGDRSSVSRTEWSISLAWNPDSFGPHGPKAAA